MPPTDPVSCDKMTVAAVTPVPVTVWPAPSVPVKADTVSVVPEITPVKLPSWGNAELRPVWIRDAADEKLVAPERLIEEATRV